MDRPDLRSIVDIAMCYVTTSHYGMSVAAGVPGCDHFGNPGLNFSPDFDAGVRAKPDQSSDLATVVLKSSNGMLMGRTSRERQWRSGASSGARAGHRLWQAALGGRAGCGTGRGAQSKGGYPLRHRQTTGATIGRSG
jgi:hypothetical protein